MDRRLLFAILKTHTVNNKKAIAEELSTDEQRCTEMAVQKRLQAIKKSITDSPTGGLSTPTKKRSAKDAETSSAKKKAKGGEMSAETVAGQDQE